MYGSDKTLSHSVGCSSVLHRASNDSGAPKQMSVISLYCCADALPVDKGDCDGSGWLDNSLNLRKYAERSQLLSAPGRYGCWYKFTPSIRSPLTLMDLQRKWNHTPDRRFISQATQNMFADHQYIHRRQGLALYQRSAIRLGSARKRRQMECYNSYKGC